MKTNRKLKSSVFSTLFDNPDVLRELYCALGKVTLPADVPIAINTLKNAMINDLYNDVSFEIGGKLIVLIEHQSTINPNIALRLLLYIAELLKKKVKGKSIYSSKKIKIPWPEFYVLYNGTEPFPDYKIVKLSELFEKPQDLGLPERYMPLLELEAKVININEGRNADILNRCRKLAEYSTLISRVYHYRNEFNDLGEAIKKAVDYCHKHDILKEYLEVYGSEVLNMLYTKWNMEDAKEVWREEGREEGREESHKEIAWNMLANGSTPEYIQKITGLDLETIIDLNNRELT
ncbi:MAG: Rpn family recombination-promoting nuclease/putative transposase [Treponema sp.]|nr:Rpn family recombination-promoting nuclease/putative transposase [Treponema sp.]